MPDEGVHEGRKIFIFVIAQIDVPLPAKIGNIQDDQFRAVKGQHEIQGQEGDTQILTCGVQQGLNAVAFPHGSDGEIMVLEIYVNHLPGEGTRFPQ